MRQVTGRTNHPHISKKVSIQLALDGHSFSLPKGAVDGQVEEIELLTEYTLLVPRELYDGAAASLFAANGQPLAADMEVVVCEAAKRPDVVALVAVPGKLLAELRERYGEFRPTTPLLTTPTVMEPTIALCDTGSLIYIKVYDKQLCLAEVVAVPDMETLSYLLQRLEGQFELRRFVAQLEARTADKQRMKLYHGYFKKVLCV